MVTVLGYQHQDMSSQKPVTGLPVQADHVHVMGIPVLPREQQGIQLHCYGPVTVQIGSPAQFASCNAEVWDKFASGMSTLHTGMQHFVRGCLDSIKQGLQSVSVSLHAVWDDLCAQMKQLSPEERLSLSLMLVGSTLACLGAFAVLSAATMDGVLLGLCVEYLGVGLDFAGVLVECCLVEESVYSFSAY